MTYNGHPLYLYAADQNPGDATGQGLKAFGAAWFTVSPAGNQVAVQATSSGNGGYGYRPQPPQFPQPQEEQTKRRTQ